MRKFWRLFACVSLLAVAGPCLADIYFFIDQEGRSHFSDVRIDERYELYMKERASAKPSAPETISNQLVEVPPATARPLGLASAQLRKRYAGMITRVAREQKIDAALIHAVVTVESAYNASAKSAKGATGLMQLMPATASQYGAKDLLNPLQNLRAGARYLRALLAKFSNDKELAIAAYNAGEGAVMRSGNTIPPYPETRAYVPRVLEFYERYRGERT